MKKDRFTLLVVFNNEANFSHSRLNIMVRKKNKSSYCLRYGFSGIGLEVFNPFGIDKGFPDILTIVNSHLK